MFTHLERVGRDESDASYFALGASCTTLGLVAIWTGLGLGTIGTTVLVVIGLDGTGLVIGEGARAGVGAGAGAGAAGEIPVAGVSSALVDLSRSRSRRAMSADELCGYWMRNASSIGIVSARMAASNALCSIFVAGLAGPGATGVVSEGTSASVSPPSDV